MMNKSVGNMYKFLNKTWNPLKGWPCPHMCDYCYVKDIRKRFGLKNKAVRLDLNDMTTNLGSGNTIFVGSSTDIFADQTPKVWIEQILDHCKKFDNTYLFQTKNPERFNEFIKLFPPKAMLGITLETNKDFSISKAPSPEKRYESFKSLNFPRKMVSVEPILDFDVDKFGGWLISLKPEFVSIGADSKNHDLEEPTTDKVKMLLNMLMEAGVKIIEKDNLKRLEIK